MKRTVAFIKAKAYVIGAVFIVIAGGLVYWYVAANQAPSFGDITVAHANIVESLDEPGSVAAENNVVLSFQEAGQIASVDVNEGDAVNAGQSLAALDASSLAAAVDQAKAALAAAQAKLDELETGTRQVQLDADQSAVATAQASLVAAIGNAYTSADDAVRNQTDNVFSNPRSNSPVLLVPVTDSQMQINIESDRVKIGAMLDAWYAADASTSDPAALAGTANGTLTSVKQYLDEVALAVNQAIPNSTVTASTLSGYKTDVVTARAEVAAAIIAVTNAEAAFTAAQNALMLAQAGTTPQAVEAQKAMVLQDQAAVASAQVALDHATLAAPFSGVVQDLTAKVGQVVSPGAPMLTLTNASGLKVEVYVSETDIGKVAVGDAADVTLDAYGTDTVFPAKVTSVDTAETTVSGTSAYKVTLHFMNPDGRIKAGMTANAHIISAEHDNVIAIPARLVLGTDPNRFVLVRQGNSVAERPVTLGITGNDGMVEITSGLSEGEEISNF